MGRITSSIRRKISKSMVTKSIPSRSLSSKMPPSRSTNKMTRSAASKLTKTSRSCGISKKDRSERHWKARLNSMAMSRGKISTQILNLGSISSRTPSQISNPFSIRTDLLVTDTRKRLPRIKITRLLKTIQAMGPNNLTFRRVYAIMALNHLKLPVLTVARTT